MIFFFIWTWFVFFRYLSRRTSITFAWRPFINNFLLFVLIKLNFHFSFRSVLSFLDCGALNFERTTVVDYVGFVLKEDVETISILNLTFYFHNTLGLHILYFLVDPWVFDELKIGGIWFWGRPIAVSLYSWLVRILRCAKSTLPWTKIWWLRTSSKRQ